MSEDDGRIVVAELSKHFGAIKAVDRLSFTVEPGSITGFLGPNGAGKTTTLRCILGLATPTSGAATIGGKPYARIHHPGRVVGAVLEANSYYPGRSARNHLLVYCAAAGLPSSRADEVLDIVGLTFAARQAVRGFSLGMRQRLGLATALLGDPQVLILDEPANGLDPEGMAWLRRFLRQLADSQGRTILISSHVLSEVQQTVDRVVILARGRMVREGTLSDLETHREASTVVRTPSPDALAAAVAPLGGKLTAAESGAYEILGLDASSVGEAACRAQVPLHELRPGGASLEEIFLELTAGVGVGQNAPDDEPEGNR